MELVAAVLDDKIPSTGEPIPYFHSFFRMGDGSTIAFFEAPELPPPSADSHPAYGTFRHFAMEVDSTATVDAWHEMADAQRGRRARPVDHGIIYSIYFRDPDGNRLEITTPLDPRWNDSAEAAQASLAEWQEVKAEAQANGSGHGLRAGRADAAPEPPAHRRSRMTAVHPTRIPRIISVDDHVVEPPHVWETWLPARSATAARRWCGVACARSGSLARRPIRRSSTTTRRPRPTRGCTRTSCTPTSGWSPRWATHATR